MCLNIREQIGSDAASDRRQVASIVGVVVVVVRDVTSPSPSGRIRSGLYRRQLTSLDAHEVRNAILVDLPVHSSLEQHTLRSRRESACCM